MIFREHESIFLHPGKTAGTAVEEAFGYTNDTHPPERLDLEVFKGWDPEQLLYVQHAPARFMRERIPSAIWDSHLKFATVRNPFDRLLSVYCFQLDRHRRWYKSFEGFVAALPKLLKERPSGFNRHVLPQTEYTHLDGALFVDLVLRFEALAEGYEALRHRLRRGPVLRAVLERVNTATGPRERRSPAEEYSPASTRIVQDLYGRDFEALGYAPEPHSEAETRRLARGAWRSPRVDPSAR